MKKIVVVFLLAGGVMLGSFRFAGWYADNSALPRYCKDPGAAIARVRDILSSETPIGDRKRRPYLVAAKLIFLVPQQDGEGIDAYLNRLSGEINQRCAVGYQGK